MWGFDTKRNRDRWRDNLLTVAPEANPHEFVRRYLNGHSPLPATPRQIKTNARRRAFQPVVVGSPLNKQ